MEYKREEKYAKVHVTLSLKAIEQVLVVKQGEQFIEGTLPTT